jgi:hypothetical protein
MYLKEVPYDAQVEPIFIEEDEPYQLLRVFILDEKGGKITSLNRFESAAQALNRIKTEERKDAAYVLLFELHHLAVIPKLED